MQLDEKSSEYPAVTINNNEIEGENLLNDYKMKTARARRKISPVHYLNWNLMIKEKRFQTLLNTFVAQMRLKTIL